MQSDAVQIENKPPEYRFILLGALNKFVQEFEWSTMEANWSTMKEKT